jgi:agmatine deiminase
LDEKANPFELGYRMPAEWEPHEGTWLAWPKNPSTFPAGILQRVERTYTEMVRSLLPGEHVHLLVDDGASLSRLSSIFGGIDGVDFRKIRTADVWIRDYGPIFVKNGDVVATKWRFNAWGNKYDDLLADDLAGKEVAESTGLRVLEPGLVLEGGSVDVNGKGSCLVTQQCLLNINRNPGRTRKQIEETLRNYLGVTNTVWLGRGIEGDDTDGHVDDLARFTGDGRVVCMTESDTSDMNHQALSENMSLLKEARDQHGREFEVVPIQMPKRRIGRAERLPASYANFYVGNSVVLVPIFGDPNDRDALSTISDLFPDRDVLGLNCEALVSGFGGIHCVTQQQPYPGV